MKNNAKEITDYLYDLADPEIAKQSQRFFKTAKGEYGYGDIFLGIHVPVLRKTVNKFRNTSITDTENLLKNKHHEIRLFALLMLVYQFNKAESDKQAKIYNLYLNNTDHINNWDLVDSSAHYIIGPYLLNKDKSILYELAESPSLWERRIAIMSTFHFIKNNQFTDTLAISRQLLHDKEDLIHKATGWMLREIGNRDHATEISFLNIHYQNMPRTMLRYAIERFDEPERQKYLIKK
jgi:3-methyladenine DNA glycosylase AlkD